MIKNVGKVDILELAEVSMSCCWHFHTSIGPGLTMVKELDVKMALEMTENRKTEPPPDEESLGRGQWFKSQSDLKPASLGVWRCPFQLVLVLVGFR